MIELLKKLKAVKGEFTGMDSLLAAINKRPEFKQAIVRAGRYFFNESVTGCNNCIGDMYLRLINYDMDKKNFEYKMTNGKLLHDPVNQDAGKLLCSANLTEDLALYHLVHNPKARKYFEKLPDDIDARIEAYKNKHSLIVDVTDTNAGELDKEIAKKQAILADLDAQIEAKTAILEAITDDDKEATDAAPPAPAEKSAKDIQDEAENAFILQIADLLKAGKTPEEIKTELKAVKKVGVLNLTAARFDKFLSEAQEFIKE
jgi:hypothetical protein